MLAFATHKINFFFQMVVKSYFLNGFIEKEGYAKQPPNFEDHTLLEHVFKLKKVVYGLK